MAGLAPGRNATASVIAKGDKMNEKAVDDFMVKIERSRELLAMIQAELDDHMGTDPDNVNWNHVGDATYVLENLRDIARFMGHAE